MWGKLRRKISRTKSAVEQDSVKEVVLNDFEIVPSYSKNKSDFLYTARSNLSDENGFLNQDGQQECRCSPLLHLQKHFFGSFRSRRVTEGSGEISAENLKSLKKKGPELENMGESSSLAEEPNGLSVRATSCNSMDCDLKCDRPAEEGKSCKLECREACILEGVSTDTVGVRQIGEREILEDIPLPLLEDTKLSPPKLKRRERTKVAETSKSELDCCSSVVSERNVESVIVQREFSVLSSVCEMRSDLSVTKATAETVCSSSSLEGHESALDLGTENALMYKYDDKEESMDSGHHPLDGDVEKGHSSPDLDLDECDGRESGYTTLDDVQPLPLEPFQSSSHKVSLDADVGGHYDERDCLSAQHDLLAPRSACETSQQSDSSTLVNEPTAHYCRSSVWLQPVGDTAVSSAEVICCDQSNSNISASFPVPFQSIDSRNLRQWEHVDYVPADVSVSKIYEDSSNSGINDVYASVPRCFVAKLEESSVGETVASDNKQSIKKSVEIRSSSSSPKHDDLENRSVANLGAGIPAAPHAVLNEPTGEWKDTDPDMSSAALDSDDGENVPPVPSRNYESCIGIMNVELKSIESQHAEESNERIHMSWEEVMREARSLGIPLNRPQLDKPYLIPYSEQLVQSDSLMPHISETSKGQRTECLLEESAVCSLNPAAKSKSETKKGSPFKEKFRLPNPFSRKNKPDRNESFTDGESGRNGLQLNGAPAKGKKSSIFRHHSSTDIQKRCLPRPPPEGADTSGINQINYGRIAQASAQSGNQRMAISLHLPLSGEASTNRSWGSSSNILRVGSTGCRSRRVFSDSSQWPDASSGSLLPFSDHGDGTVVCVDSSSSLISTNSNADFIQSFSKLKDCGWYWGPLGWENAEAKLEDKPDGSFLVRDSSDDRYILSLSFRSQNMTHHTRIEHYKGMFSFYSQPKSHGASTIVEFIEKAMEHSRSGKFLYFLRPRAPGLPPAPVQLLFPISRLRNMHSLQHICRFVILKHVRRDLIDRLQIPPRLKEYLKEMQYYIEFSDCDSMGHQYFSQEW